MTAARTRVPFSTRKFPNTAEIRQVHRTAEFERFRELLLEYEAALAADLRHGGVPAVAELQLRYARPNVAFVATREGDPAGCVAVTMLDASTAVILRLYVRPQCRGLGIARALVNAAIGFAREGGFSRIVLDTNKRLAAAFELYRSFGFTECAPFGSVSYACPTFMELRIS